MPQLSVIDKFDGKYRYLSNFYTCPVLYDGRVYPSGEHAYQAAKTLSNRERIKISECATPGQAKRMGQSVKLRPNWEEKKTTIMYRIVKWKFEHNGMLRKKLLETGNAKLIEGNNWGDTEWGMVWIDGEWQGENLLGKILMDVRAELQ